MKEALIGKDALLAQKQPSSKHEKTFQDFSIAKSLKRRRSEKKVVPETPLPSRGKRRKPSEAAQYVTAAMDLASQFETSQPTDYEESVPNIIPFTQSTDSESIDSLMDLDPKPTNPDLIGDRARQLLAQSEADPEDRRERAAFYRFQQGFRPYRHHGRCNVAQRKNGLYGSYDLSGRTLPALRKEDSEKQESWYNPQMKTCPFCPTFSHLYHSFYDFPIKNEYPTLKDLVYHVTMYHYPFINTYSCDPCDRRFPTPTAYLNHYNAELRKERDSQSNARPHNKAMRSTEVLLPTVERCFANPMYIPPLLPTRLMPAKSDIKRKVIQFGPFTFKAILFDDHPLNPHLMDNLSRNYPFPPLDAHFAITKKLHRFAKTNNINPRKPKTKRAPIHVLPALHGKVPLSADIDNFFEPEPTSKSDTDLRSIITSSSLSRSSSTTSVASATTKNQPQPVQETPVFKIPQPPAPTRTTSETSMETDIQDSILSKEDWDADIAENPYPPTILGRAITMDTSTPKPQFAQTVPSATPVARPKSLPVQSSPVIQKKPRTQSDDRSDISSTRESRADFGLLTIGPKGSQNPDPPESRVNPSRPEPYYRKPMPFQTPQLRNGASDIPDTGFSPRQLPDSQNTAHMLFECARPIRERTLPGLSELPSTELASSDLFHDLQNCLNARRSRLQSLYRHSTNMAQPTAPCDNYAVQLRDNLFQSIRSADLLVQHTRTIAVATLDATARQYELEAAAAIANRAADASMVENLQREIRTLKLAQNSLEEQLNKVNARATRLNLERNQLTRDVAQSNKQLREAREAVDAAREDPLANIDQKAAVNAFDSHLESTYDPATMNEVRPLWDSVKDMLRHGRNNAGANN